MAARIRRLSSSFFSLLIVVFVAIDQCNCHRRSHSRRRAFVISSTALTSLQHDEGGCIKSMTSIRGGASPVPPSSSSSSSPYYGNNDDYEGAGNDRYDDGYGNDNNNRDYHPSSSSSQDSDRKSSSNPTYGEYDRYDTNANDGYEQRSSSNNSRRSSSSGGYYDAEGRYRTIDDDDDYYNDSRQRRGRRSESRYSSSKSSSPFPSAAVLTQPNRKLGLLFLGGGTVFTLLGITLFFNKTLMRVGNLLFVIGVPLLLGPGRTAGYFLQPRKARATGCLGCGIFLVFVGHPLIGIILELFGILNLFGNMFPLVLIMAKNLPVVGGLFGGSGSSSGGTKRRERESSRYNEDDDRHYNDAPRYERDTYR